MKIVHVLGGLGNQMFQYAFAIALKNEFPTDVIKIDVSTFNGYNLHNGFEIEKIFGKHLQHASFIDICKVSWPFFHYRLWQIGMRILPQRSSMVRDKAFPTEFKFESIQNKKYFLGYWGQSKFFEKYRNEILKVFSFPKITDNNNLHAIDFIKSKKTAFIHVRRGDYINHPTLGGVCTVEYYVRAIHRLRTEFNYNHFIVFSNDIPWCRETFKEQLSDSETLFVDWNKGVNSFRDMQLMSYCQSGIIANSSFSYWGAWLSDAEIILRPEKWTNGEGYLKDILPEKWERVCL